MQICHDYDIVLDIWLHHIVQQQYNSSVNKGSNLNVDGAHEISNCTQQTTKTIKDVPFVYLWTEKVQAVSNVVTLYGQSCTQPFSY